MGRDPSAMDPPSVEGSRRRHGSATGRGGKGRRLGLKNSSVPAPSPHQDSSIGSPQVSRPSATSSPSVPTQTPASPATSSPAAPATSSPGVPLFTMPPWTPQGAGWGAVCSNFSSLHANQRDPNSWYVCFTQYMCARSSELSMCSLLSELLVCLFIFVYSGR